MVNDPILVFYFYFLLLYETLKPTLVKFRLFKKKKKEAFVKFRISKILLEAEHAHSMHMQLVNLIT